MSQIEYTGGLWEIKNFGRNYLESYIFNVYYRSTFCKFRLNGRGCHKNDMIRSNSRTQKSVVLDEGNEVLYDPIDHILFPSWKSNDYRRYE